LQKPISLTTYKQNIEYPKQQGLGVTYPSGRLTLIYVVDLFHAN